VGCWMLGIDGVELDQIQRVFKTFWANPHPLPSLEGSPGRRRQIDAAVEYMAAPGASVGARRRLRTFRPHQSATLASSRMMSTGSDKANAIGDGIL
jgi:hypothetical protein